MNEEEEEREEEAERVVPRELWVEEPLWPVTRTLGERFVQEGWEPFRAGRRETDGSFLQGPSDSRLAPSPEEVSFKEVLEQYWEKNLVPQIVVSEEVNKRNMVAFRMENSFAMSMQRLAGSPSLADTDEERKLAETYEKYREAKLGRGGQPLAQWEWELLQGQTDADLLQQQRDLEDRKKVERPQPEVKRRKPAVKQRPDRKTREQ